MPRNRIQFQKGLPEPQFNKLYGTEEACFEALEKLRWPKGFVCPGCLSWLMVPHPIFRFRRCAEQRWQRTRRLEVRGMVIKGARFAGGIEETDRPGSRLTQSTVLHSRP